MQHKEIMKKLLILNNNAFFYDGNKMLVYKQTGQLFEALSQEFYLEAFHFKIKKDDIDSLADFDLNSLPIKITSISVSPQKLVNYFLAYYKLFRRIIKSDIVYLFYPNSFYLGAIFSFLLQKPYGIYIRGEKGINSKVSQFIFKKAKFVLTVSPKFSNEIRLFNQDVLTIKPMISYDIKEGLAKRDLVKKEISVLFVGRIEYDKGVFELVDAFKLLIAESKTKLKLNLVGDGKSLHEVKRLIEVNNLEDSVNVLGPVYDKEKLKDIYLSNDIFILPTHHEGFPRVLYEAMIFKIPIITTFVGTISNLMKDGFNCLEIPVKNSNGIKEKLEALINDENLRVKLINNGTLTITEYIGENSETHSDLIIKLFNNG